jgi:hypothetical protein
MALAWKAGKVQAFVGSNPTLSARLTVGHPGRFGSYIESGARTPIKSSAEAST